MFQPELYEQSKTGPLLEASSSLDEYFHLIKLRADGNDCILDVGCADGGTTLDVILKKFPTKRETIVGCDKSKEMIDYANERHVNETRSTFRILDIETEQLPDDMIGKFDHIFSMYTLQYMQKIE